MLLTYSALLATCFHAGLYFVPEDGGDMFLRKVGGLINGLHDVISHKIKLFIFGSFLVRISFGTPTMVNYIFVVFLSFSE
jgi:hypothetical protein